MKRSSPSLSSSLQSLSSVAFLLFTLVLLFSFVVPSAHAETADEQAIKETVGAYYGEFLSESMDGYLATQYLDHLDADELQEKKDRVQQLWDSFAFGYATDTWHEITVENDVAVARYILTANIFDANSYDGEKFAYELDTTAILFKVKNDWKIYTVAPTTQINYEVFLDDAGVVDAAAQTFEKLDNTPETTPLNETPAEITLLNSTNGTGVEPTCAPDLARFENSTFDLAAVPGASALIGDDKRIELRVADKRFHYLVKGNKIAVSEPSDGYDFLISVDPCTIERILSGADPQTEYDAGNIDIEGGSFGDSVKLTLGKVVFWFYGIFTDDEPYQLWIEAETGRLENVGRYSFIGATSRGPGELYLGDGGAQATYAVESDYEGLVHLYIRVSDDGLHPNGARSATFIVNGVELPYSHISRNYVVDGKFWGWEHVGTTTLKKDENVIVVKKPQQTGAAFTMDKLILSENEFTPS